MGQRRIAYTAEESLLLTVDRGSVIAHEAVDGSVKWTLSFDEVNVVAVVYASTSALPSDVAAGPWRSPSSASTAVALDSEGTLHAIDVVLGRELGTVKDEGEPVTLASGGDAIAVAYEDRVVLYRAGAKSLIAKKAATALAFSRDGLTLALGTAKGDLFFVDVATIAVKGSEPPAFGTISDVVARPGGGWLVSTDRGLTAVYEHKSEKQLNGSVTGAVVDPAGKHLAVHRSEANVVVYEWPPTVPVGRINASGGTIRDISFGPNDKIGVAMAGGGAAMVDPETYAVVRTAPRPGEPRAQWMVSAESEKARVERTEEQSRRAQAHEPKSGLGARLGIGGMISLAILVVRIFLIGARASSPSWTPPPDFGRFPTSNTCDYACEVGRLTTLQISCRSSRTHCETEATAALDAFEAGDCAKAREQLAKVKALDAATPGGGDALVGAEALLAEMGLASSCRMQKLAAPTVLLVHLEGTSLSVKPDTLDLDGADDNRIWSASDGTLFLARRDLSRQTCRVMHRSAGKEEWTTDFEGIRCQTVGLYGRSSREVYLNLGDSIRRFDGKAWSGHIELPEVADTIAGASAPGSDVFAATSDETLVQVNGKTFAEAKTVSFDGGVPSLFSGTSLWGYERNESSIEVLHKWNGKGWTRRAVMDDGGTSAAMFNDLWQSPNGHIFMIKDLARVVRSTNDGATWDETVLPKSAEHLWGRSSSDVYAAGTAGLLHFDGKSWKETSYTTEVAAITGDAKDLHVLSIIHR